MKDAYARVGRYNKPIENGYIDGELNNAIRGIQRDYNLKRDGYMNPGGETEAMLIGEALGIEKKPEPSDQIKTASAAPAIPAIATSLAEILGTTAAGAMALWQSMHKDKREKALDDLQDSPALTDQPDDDPNEKPHCEKQWHRDAKKCSKAYKEYGARAYQGCRACAEQRYGDCRAGLKARPLSFWTGGD